MGEGQVKQGWFSTQGRPGDRTLADQMKGLGWLFENCAGKVILDVGCAEGLLSIELAKRGAIVDGVDVVPGHIEVANRLAAHWRPKIDFRVADANTWHPLREYDIVLLLAVLHKLRDPSLAAATMAGHARKHVVLRLPPLDAPIIVDSRSGNQPHNIHTVMKSAGFSCIEANYDGHFGEWIGVYERT
jgi:2-polyprenyl-3-methyl-5-hydroxy-6-metoxy-1,4-benzoquinol methylase